MSTFAVILTATNICDNVIVWDDTEHPWTPPADHYVVSIDGLSVGIGWFYNQSSGVWTAPPSVEANFSPALIFLTQGTSLIWATQNADSVTLSTNPGETFPANGSLGYTPTAIGKFSVTVTVSGPAGSASTVASVSVVATQAELVI
jgi:hypothetical protein